MPKGTDFLCRNFECENIDTKISIHGPFPIALIKEIMDLPSIVSDPSHYANLANKSREGREYALIPIPNKDGIKPKGIRIQYYVPKTRTILDIDLIWGKDDERIRDLISGKDESEGFSEKTGIEVLSLGRLIEKGFPCPSCGAIMESVNWFTNTGVSDWGDPNASVSN